MAISPWAQIRNAQTPIDAETPSVWAPIPEETQFESATGSHSVDPMGKTISADPRLESAINYHQDEGMKARKALARPYGFAGAGPSAEFPEGLAPNHNTKMGKVAHIFSQIGNIAGNIVAPDVMARIPGTEMFNRSQQALNTGAVDKELGEKATQEQQGAETGHLRAETEQVAPNAEAQRRLQGQTGHHLDVESNLAEHPLPEYTPLGYLTPEGQATEMEKHSGAVTGAGPEGLRYAKMVDKFQHVAGTLNGVPMQAAFDPINHIFINPDTGEQITGFRPQPQPAMLGPIGVSDTGKVSRATPGITLPEGFRTITQQGSLEIPTQTQRTAAGRADTVLSMIPEMNQRLDSMRGQIGPEMGRWNDFMQGRVGTSNPDFAALRSDMLMMSSAVALAHAQGRLPENLREEFDHAINAPQQTPENLKATINAMVPWLQKVQQQGEAKGGPLPQTAPAPAPTQKVLKYNPSTGRLE